MVEIYISNDQSIDYLIYLNLKVLTHNLGRILEDDSPSKEEPFGTYCKVIIQCPKKINSLCLPYLDFFIKIKLILH